MVEGLCSKVAMEKSNDRLVRRVIIANLANTRTIVASLTESRCTKELQEELFARVADIEPKFDTIFVSHAKNALFVPNPCEQHSLYVCPPFVMEVPRFDVTGPLGWILKKSRFFNFHNTAKEQRIQIASFYLDGPVLSWYGWMFYNNQLLSWTDFLHALEARFGPSCFDDPEGALFKLK